MRAFRIARTQYIRDISGFGAYQFGGRWNSKGVRMLYLADSAALALLEVLVHLPNFDVATSYSLLTVEFPDSLNISDVGHLPADWRKTPSSPVLAQLGDRFISGQSDVLLRVPSCIVPMSFSILANPLHADFGRIQIVNVEEFEMEKRLFGVKTGL